jgi:hypothetical protein
MVFGAQLRSFAAVFSNEKSFSHPVIGSARLNRWGLHLLRILLADACYLVRTLPWLWLHPVLWWRFMRDGYVVLPDFLPAAECEAVRREYEAAASRYWNANPLERTGEQGFGAKRPRQGGFDRFDGDSGNRFFDIAPGGAVHRNFQRGRRYGSLALALFGMVNRARKHALYDLVHGDEGLNSDIQRQLHEDTFHHTFKSWYYLDAVTAAQGPTEVVRGSHRSTWRRLLWEYRLSQAGCSEEQLSSAGSFRVGVEELAALGLPPPQALLCPANSLVVVNTKAFHRRGMAARDTVRRSIYANFRPRAFRPVLH